MILAGLFSMNLASIYLKHNPECPRHPPDSQQTLPDSHKYTDLRPRSLLEAPKWVKDPGNGLKSIRGRRDHFGGISGVLDTFRGL